MRVIESNLPNANNKQFCGGAASCCARCLSAAEPLTTRGKHKHAAPLSRAPRTLYKQTKLHDIREASHHKASYSNAYARAASPTHFRSLLRVCLAQLRSQTAPAQQLTQHNKAKVDKLNANLARLRERGPAGPHTNQTQMASSFPLLHAREPARPATAERPAAGPVYVTAAAKDGVEPLPGIETLYDVFRCVGRGGRRAGQALGRH